MKGSRWTRWKNCFLTIAGTLVPTAGIAGCAPGGAIGDPRPSILQAVVFENVSPDMVRVSLYTNAHELVLGRVGPFERKTLPLRPRTLPPESEAVCLVVVPVGTPSVIKPGPLSAGAIRSEFYPISELTRQMWTYSGSRVVVAKLPNR